MFHKKGKFMLKKLFLSAAIVALVFTACDSDSSTSPKNDEQPKDNVSEQSGSINGDGADNTVVQTNPVSANTSTEVPCSVEKLSANSFVIKMKEDDAKTTITTTIAGGQTENDYVIEFNESVSMTIIQSLCESTKSLMPILALTALWNLLKKSVKR